MSTPFTNTIDVENYKQLLEYVKNCPMGFDTTILLAFWENQNLHGLN